MRRKRGGGGVDDLVTMTQEVINVEADFLS